MKKTNLYTGSNSLESAQQAVNNGYVGSTDEYFKASGLASPMATEPTIAEQYKPFKYDTTGNPYDVALGQSINKLKVGANVPIDENQIRRNTMSLFQAEIDATNQIYAQKLAESKAQGLGRLGSTNALQARSGLLGSDFGQSQNQNILGQNNDINNSIRAEQAAIIGSIQGKVRQSVADELTAKRQAQQTDAATYLDYLSKQGERNTSRTSNFVKTLLAQGIDPKEISPEQLSQLSKDLGTSVDDIRQAYKESKDAEDLVKAQAEQEAQKALQDSQFNLSEGQSRYSSDGTLIASKGKTYAPSSGGGSGYSSGGGTPVSSAAQNILDIMNKNGGTVDDYVKGSIASQDLRNEIYSALSNQGGSTDKNVGLITEGKAVIDDMINKSDWKKFGYSSVLGGKFTTGYGDMKQRASQISAILARDNLGLLKGAMSDKDLAFIQSMSGGVSEGTISETYAKERMESIQTKLKDKIDQSAPTQTGGQPSEEQQLLDQGYTQEQIDALKNS